MGEIRSIQFELQYRFFQLKKSQIECGHSLKLRAILMFKEDKEKATCNV